MAAPPKPTLPRLDITTDIQSLTAFRRSSSEVLKQLKKTGRPVILTVNGKAEPAVQDAESYQRLLNIAAYGSAEQGIDGFENGRTVPVQEAFDRIHSKSGTPR
jgi:prevent-host-death family protein